MSGYTEILVVDANGIAETLDGIGCKGRDLLPDDFLRYLMILDNTTGVSGQTVGIEDCVYDCSQLVPGNAVGASLGCVKMEAVLSGAVKLLDSGVVTFGRYTLSQEEVGAMRGFIDCLLRVLQDFSAKGYSRFVITYG